MLSGDAPPVKNNCRDTAMPYPYIIPSAIIAEKISKTQTCKIQFNLRSGAIIGFYKG
jgi:hypothetical protein